MKPLPDLTMLCLPGLFIEGSLKLAEYAISIFRTRRLVIFCIQKGTYLFTLKRFGAPIMRWILGLRYFRTLKSSQATHHLTLPGAPRAMWLDLKNSPVDMNHHGVVAVFVHGGAFVVHTPTEYLFAGHILPLLAEKGIACRVLCLDYTVCPDGSVPNALEQLLYSWSRLTCATTLDDGTTPSSSATSSPTSSSSSNSPSSPSRTLNRKRSGSLSFSQASANQLAGSGYGCKVVLCGDSAGGHLVAAMTQQLLKQQRIEEGDESNEEDVSVCIKKDPYNIHQCTSIPPALICFSPWMGLETYLKKEKEEFFPYDIIQESFLKICVKLIAQAQNYDQKSYPLASNDGVFNYNMSGSTLAAKTFSTKDWPRSLICSGAQECIRKDAFHFAKILGINTSSNSINPINVKIYGEDSQNTENDDDDQSSGGFHSSIETQQDYCHQFNKHLLLEDLNGGHDWPLIEMFESKRGISREGMNIIADFIIASTCDYHPFSTSAPSYILMK